MKKHILTITKESGLLIFAGALAGIVGSVLAGNLVLPISDSTLWASQVTSEYYFLSRILFILGYILPLVGFLNVYLGLSNKQAYGKIGFIFTLIGTMLAFPILSMSTFISPSIATIYLNGQTEIIDVINAAYQGISLNVNILGGVLYLLGSSLLAASIWGVRRKDRISSMLFLIHGIGLTFGFGYYPLLILGWSSLLVFSVVYQPPNNT